MPELHDSLLDLREQAPLCATPATAKSVLEESHIVLRNSLNHHADAWGLTAWFSALVTEVLHSPALSNLAAPGSRIVVTGAFGRGHGLPTSGLQWFVVTPDSALSDSASHDNTHVVDLLCAAGLDVAAVPEDFSPTTRSEWEKRIFSSVHSCETEKIALFADAGSWATPALIEVLRDYSVVHDNDVFPPHMPSPHFRIPYPLHTMLRDVYSLVPQKIPVVHGLPDKKTQINIHDMLIKPISALARWAGLVAGSMSGTVVTHTDDRIRAAVASEVLTDVEGSFLLEAWSAAVDLQLHRWADRASGDPVELGYLSAVHRAAFCAALQLVTDVFSSVERKFF